MKRLLIMLLIALPLSGQRSANSRVIPLLPQETAKWLQLKATLETAEAAAIAAFNAKCKYANSIRSKYGLPVGVGPDGCYAIWAGVRVSGDFSDDGKYLIGEEK